MATLVWEDPTPDGRGRATAFTEKIRATLREWPGRWARIIDPEGNPNAAASRATDWRKRWGPEGFEFVSRKGQVYARYNPPLQQEGADA